METLMLWESSLENQALLTVLLSALKDCPCLFHVLPDLQLLKSHDGISRILETSSCTKVGVARTFWTAPAVEQPLSVALSRLGGPVVSASQRRYLHGLTRPINLPVENSQSSNISGWLWVKRFLRLSDIAWKISSYLDTPNGCQYRRIHFQTRT